MPANTRVLTDLRVDAALAEANEDGQGLAVQPGVEQLGDVVNDCKKHIHTQMGGTLFMKSHTHKYQERESQKAHNVQHTHSGRYFLLPPWLVRRC